MFEFKGIDLSTKYVTPATFEWLAENAGDDFTDAPVEACIYDNGYGILIWAYSVYPEDDRIPPDLANIIRAAYDHDWRFIVLDADGADCELFPSHESEWL